MEIRKLNFFDKDSIQNFFDEMDEISASFFNVNHGNEKRVMGYFDSTTVNHDFFGAFENDICVGIMFFWDLEKSIPWFGIAVRSGMQGKGIGTAMINYLKIDLTNNGYSGLLLRTAETNTCAIHLYEKCGFERIGIHPSGELLYILRLEKRNS